MVGFKRLLDHACMQIGTDFVYVSVNEFRKVTVQNSTYEENEVTSDDLYIVVFTGLGLGLGKATQTA